MRIRGETHNPDLVLYSARRAHRRSPTQRQGATPILHRPHAHHNMPPTKALKTYIVEDSPMIREDLIATLEELVPVEVVA